MQRLFVVVVVAVVWAEKGRAARIASNEACTLVAPPAEAAVEIGLSFLSKDQRSAVTFGSLAPFTFDRHDMLR